MNRFAKLGCRVIVCYYPHFARPYGWHYRRLTFGCPSDIKLYRKILPVPAVYYRNVFGLYATFIDEIVLCAIRAQVGFTEPRPLSGIDNNVSLRATFILTQS